MNSSDQYKAVAERDYLESIEQAIGPGNIVVHGESHDSEKWRHIHWGGSADTSRLGSLQNTNTRDMALLPHRLLQFLPNQGRVAVFGHGAGREVSQIVLDRPDAHISSVGLEPISPLHILEKNAQAIAGEASRYEIANKRALSFTRMLELQREGKIQFLRKTEIPVVQEQHIGYFPHDVELQDKAPFDFLLDSYATLTHSHVSNMSRREMFDVLFPFVSDQGVFCFSTLPPYYFDELDDGEDIEALMRSVARRSEGVVIVDQSRRFLSNGVSGAVFKERHPLLGALPQDLLTQGRILDFGEIQEHLET